jgi:FkbH-like protein
MDITKVKLVIWDLDDTFWNGTISEGEISAPEENIKLIKDLTDCGIINTICSKNDFSVAQKKLEELGVWEYFVCPSINWETKGARVKELISLLQLRDANALFIDDNPSNINEVKFYNGNIMTAMPSDFEEIYKAVDELPRKDQKHERLERYKIIEKKAARKEQAGSNLEFLRECNIKVQIHENCIDELDRLHELLMRTNQLNYTKKRLSREELLSDLNNESYKCGYVTVTDDYGDYGIVGFYCVDGARLEHFSFSCRCMGMGIEQYVYSELNFPELEVVGEVSVNIEKNVRPDWINSSSSSSHKEKDSIGDNVKVLLKGPCDMSQIFSFIKENDNIDCEFTYTSPTGVAIELRNHSQCILQGADIAEEQKRKIVDELPFSDEDMFKQMMFENDYNIVFYSTLTDCGTGVYRRKSGEYIAFSEYIHPLTDENEWEGYKACPPYALNCHFTTEQLQYIKDNYEYVGRLTPDQIVENIKKILDKLPEKTYLVLLLGSEIPFTKIDSPNYADRHLFHKELNDKIKELSKTNSRLKYIEFTKYVKSQNDYFNNINHFMKPVYYEVSKEMINIISELLNVQIEKKGKISFIKQYVKQILKRTFKKPII